MTPEKVQELINSDPKLPIFVDAIDMQQYEHDLLVQIHKSLLDFCDANYLDALEQSSNFQFVEKQHRIKDDPDRTSYRPYVRMRYGTTVSAEWYIAQLIPKATTNAKNHESVKWFVRRINIKKNVDGNYPKTLFKKSPEWVKTMGEKSEEIFKIVRRRNTILGEVRDKLYELDRLNRKMFEMNEIIQAQPNKIPKPINQEFIQTLRQNSDCKIQK